MSSTIYAFEEIDDSLPFLPLAARRALDAVGRKLALDGWLSLSIEDRLALIAAGVGDTVDGDSALAAIRGASPAAAAIPPVAEPPRDAPPPALLTALGGARSLDAERWSRLGALDRYALMKLAARPEKVARAFDHIVGAKAHLAHLNAAGEAWMVDVAAKGQTHRRAVASARVRMSAAVLDQIASGESKKGDVFAVARIAGIQGAKRTPELIPLCHTVALTRVEVGFDVDRTSGTVVVRAVAEAYDRTGVEMEALVAASIAALTLYDMVKSADRWMTISEVRLEEKSGGRSGEITRPTEGER